MRHYDDGPNRAVSEQQYSKAILCLHNKSDVVVGRELGQYPEYLGAASNTPDHPLHPCMAWRWLFGCFAKN